MKALNNPILWIVVLGMQACQNPVAVPSYLKDQAEAFKEDPRQAKLEWF